MLSTGSSDQGLGLDKLTAMKTVMYHWIMFAISFAGIAAYIWWFFRE
jgi:hypothetical protein